MVEWRETSIAFWLTARMPRPRGAQQALLAAGDGKVDAPVIHPEIERGDGTDAIDEEKRVVEARIERPAHGGDVGGDAGRGLVVGDEDGLDLVLRVGPETPLEFGHRHARAPGHVDHLHVEAEAFGHLHPQRRELAEAGHQDLVAGVQRVGDRRLPGRRAGAGEDEDLARRGAHDALEVREKTQSQLAEIRRAHVLLPDIHRAADLVGDIGRTGNEQMGVTGFHVKGSSSPGLGWTMPDRERLRKTFRVLL